MQILLKKIGYVLLLATLLAGCASIGQPYKLFPGESKEFATLTSSFDDEVKKLVEEKLGINLGFRGPRLSAALLIEVDNISGDSVTLYIGRTFNGSWGGQFTVQILPGAHQLVLMPNYQYANRDDKVTMDIATIAGHQYFVGNVIEILQSPVVFSPGIYIVRGKYRWTPVVVDKTAMSLIYPEGKE